VTSELTIDPTAVLWSAPERDRAGRPLIVLLHGYGSHEGDLFGLSPRLPLGPVVASVRAPLEESGGYAWFTCVNSIPGDPPQERVDAAASAVTTWLDAQQFSSVALLGFSQGAAVALQLLRQTPTRFAAAVALSGFVASGPNAGDEELARVRPPVFYGRGTADPIIPADAVNRTDAWLADHAMATTNIYEDLAHSISADELTHVSSFLAGALR